MEAQTRLVGQIPGREVAVQIVVSILKEFDTLLSLFWLGTTLQPYNFDPMTYIHNQGKEHLCLNSPADPRGQYL